MQKIHFGLVLPQELGYSVDDILNSAIEAERLGFDSVYVYDHFLWNIRNNIQNVS